MTAEAGRLAFGEIGASGISTGELAQYKLDRLFELRAVIDSLRADSHQDLPPDSGAEHDL